MPLPGGHARVVPAGITTMPAPGEHVAGPPSRPEAGDEFTFDSKRHEDASATSAGDGPLSPVGKMMKRVGSWSPGPSKPRSRTAAGPVTPSNAYRVDDKPAEPAPPLIRRIESSYEKVPVGARPGAVLHNPPSASLSRPPPFRRLFCPPARPRARRRSTQSSRSSGLLGRFWCPGTGSCRDGTWCCCR